VIQQLNENHQVDGDGKPAGGFTEGKGIRINWQDGPLGRGAERQEPNGAFVEGVIQAALGRLRFYQATEFACPENEAAIGSLEQALRSCASRTADREARGVEGTHAQ
jgi:hypothetical protein